MVCLIHLLINLEVMQNEAYVTIGTYKEEATYEIVGSPPKDTHTL